jgi:hypothetical protein
MKKLLIIILLVGTSATYLQSTEEKKKAEEPNRIYVTEKMKEIFLDGFLGGLLNDKENVLSRNVWVRSINPTINNFKENELVLIDKKFDINNKYFLKAEDIKEFAQEMMYFGFAIGIVNEINPKENNISIQTLCDYPTNIRRIIPINPKNLQYLYKLTNVGTILTVKSEKELEEMGGKPVTGYNQIYVITPEMKETFLKAFLDVNIEFSKVWVEPEKTIIEPAVYRNDELVALPVLNTNLMLVGRNPKQGDETIQLAYLIDPAKGIEYKEMQFPTPVPFLKLTEAGTILTVIEKKK